MTRRDVPTAHHEAVVVIVRTTQEAIVVNLDGLAWSDVRTDDPGTPSPTC
ncbi:hypothetical protein [Frankia canadensis]|nr:hypothetical protein [Frankia canadensis]